MPPAVLVTGCSSGIGRATALALASHGLPTYATARRIEDLADLAAAGCRVLQLDVTDEESRVQAVRTVQAESGGVLALVNNAGYSQGGPVEEVSLELLRRQFETNVFGLVRMCQLVLPGMRERRHGTIVNMGSVGGLLSAPGASAYMMTKWALETMSDSLRVEVARFGVRVVLIEPGGVRTNFAQTHIQGAVGAGETRSGPYDDLMQAINAGMQRLGRSGPGISEPEKVARVVVRAIVSSRPRTRYRIGLGSRLLPLAYRLLPDRTFDTLMASQFGWK